MFHMLSSFSNPVWQILPCYQICVEPVLPERPLRKRFLLGHFRQIAGWNSASMGNSSRRPASIKKLNSRVERGP